MRTLLLALLLAAPASARELDGAAVYRANCGRCHQARQPDELTAEQWRTVTFHMRTRALLTPKEVEAVEAFLTTPPRTPASSKVLADPLVAERCQRCHDVGRIDDAVATGRTEAEWRQTLDRMRLYGATLSPDEMARLAHWLSRQSLPQ